MCRARLSAYVVGLDLTFILVAVGFNKLNTDE